MVKKRDLDAVNGKGVENERMLWHGTSVDTLPQINKSGFNRAYCGKNGWYSVFGAVFEVRYMCVQEITCSVVDH